MLFRVKTQDHASYKKYHHVPVGTILHPSDINIEFKCGSYHNIAVGKPWMQSVPVECLERIPHNKTNLRKHKKQYRGY